MEDNDKAYESVYHSNPKKVTLVDSTNTSDIIGEVVTYIILNGQLCISRVVYVLKYLCVNKILGNTLCSDLS